jgi:internalin A
MTERELLERIEQVDREKSEELDLTSKALGSLPDQLWQLRSLKRLRLGDNRLREIPDEIAELSNLEWLDLYDNELEEIPNAVTRLPNLQMLLLAGNQLESIFDSIAQLSNLRILDLSNNRLSTISNGIFNLSNLEWLDISNNEITEIGSGIDQLTKLTTLDLSNNDIQELPDKICQLENLLALDLRGNPQLMDNEILEDYLNSKKILNYYFRQQREEARRLNEAKVIFVGQAIVGKTSLIKRLFDNSFDPRENTTRGIEIRQEPIGIDRNGVTERVMLNIWDFGGQEIMFATHQFFLTERSLYLLVINTRQDERANQIDYWLKMIASLGKDSPIFIVGNKVDQQPIDLNTTELQRQYPNIKDFFSTSCLTGDGIRELTEGIKEQIGRMESVFAPIPKSYFKVKTQLEKMKRQNMTHIPYSEFEEICRGNGITDEEEHSILAKNLHNLGIALNFAEDHRAILRATSVLNPHWIVQGVYRIINDNRLITEFNGKLTWGDQKRAFQSINPDDDSYIYSTENNRQFVIDIMEKFELCFKLETSEKPDYLIPSLLRKEEPHTGDWENSLDFELHYGRVLPQSVISRFIVRSHNIISRNTYWRTGVILAKNEARAYVKADIDGCKIVISITSNDSIHRRNFLEIILEHFDAINKTIGAFSVNKRIPLPDKRDVTVSYDHLLTLEKNQEKKYFPEGADHSYDVEDLLNGIESLQEIIEDLRNRLEVYGRNNPNATEKQIIEGVSLNISMTKKRRLMSMFQAGGKAAIENILGNAYVNIVMNAIEGWLNPD